MHQPEQSEERHIQELEEDIDADLENARRKYPDDPNWFLYYLRDLHEADSGAESAPKDEKRELMRRISILDKGVTALANHIFLDPTATMEDVEAAVIERHEQTEGTERDKTNTANMDTINEYFGTVINASDTYKTMLEKLRNKRNELRDRLNELQLKP